MVPYASTEVSWETDIFVFIFVEGLFIVNITLVSNIIKVTSFANQ